MAFKDVFESLKKLLKDNLTTENTEFLTKMDKALDNLNVEHTTTETKLTQAQDKILEIVKSTSFKIDSEKSPAETDTDEPMSLDDAIDAAIKELESNRDKK